MAPAVFCKRNLKFFCAFSPDIDDCVGTPCSNGGTCVDGIQDFSCTCATGFTGEFCDDGKSGCGSATAKIATLSHKHPQTDDIHPQQMSMSVPLCRAATVAHVPTRLDLSPVTVLPVGRALPATKVRRDCRVLRRPLPNKLLSFTSASAE